MACNAWPRCSMPTRCARCAVLDRCLAQVRLDWFGERKPDGPPTVAHGYSGQAAYDRVIANVRRQRSFRLPVAEQVADRLIAWLAWPGEECHVCRDLGGHFVRTRRPDFYEWPTTSDDRTPGTRQIPCPNRDTHPLHPLDRTPAAELRSLVDQPCSQCNGAGDLVVNDGELRIYCCRTGRETNWPTVAVICDELDRAGMWGDVHAWRPDGAQAQRPPQIYTPSWPMGGI